MNIREVLRLLGELAPLEAQAKWDASGVQVAGEVEDIRRMAVTLEPVPDILAKAVESGAQLVVTHHPLSLKPSLPKALNAYRAVLKIMLSAGAWLYAAHTSLDVRTGGPAAWLGRELGLANATILEPTGSPAVLELVFHVENLVTRERAEAWAESPGVLSVAQDRTGEVRLACSPEALAGVMDTLGEELGRKPDFYLRQMSEPGREYGFGLVGDLPEPMESADFVARVAELARRPVVSVAGPRPESVVRVAVCPGSGASLLDEAAARADAYVTGDVKYHDAVDARCMVIDVGHFSLEEEMTRRFAAEIKEALLDEVQVDFLPGRDPFAYHWTENGKR